MRQKIENPLANARRARRRLMLATALAVPLAVLGAASPALALKAAEKAEFLPFADCPLTTAQTCILSETSGGELTIGSKTTPITKPILLQGGLAERSLEAQHLIAAAKGETLEKVAEEVPGGLVGVGGLGGEVTATTELAAPVSSVVVSAIALALQLGPAVTLPIKIHLQNEFLGENCYIGSNAEPIVLHMTTGWTTPPEGTERIKGERVPATYGAKKKILKIAKAKLVDNSFAVPAATGCGSVPEVEDEVINSDIGLPSAAGKNTAIFESSLEETASEFVTKYLPKEKKSKK